MEVARRWTPLLEIQKKGRWAAFKSVQRYEKGGRLTQPMYGYPLEAQAHMLHIESLVGEYLLRRAQSIPLPSGAR